MLLKLLAAVTLVALVMSVYWWGSELGIIITLSDGNALKQWFTGLGVWGPLAVTGLMVFAILVSPIPSAPIALASGAIYGHFWGALYVLTGSELGAIVAFSITRFLGLELTTKWFGERLNKGLVGSQNFLMGAVFISRLLPFISFDVISYAAGLTILSFWRFTIATFAGIVPASFLLAHLGSEMVANETDRILIAVAVLGAFTSLPFVLKLIIKTNRD